MVVKTTTRKVKVLELKEKAVSKKQQRFFGMVRAAQKGEGSASPEVAKVAGEISKKDAKDFAKTKHKGLPEKVKVKEGLSVKDAKKLNKASALDQSNDPKDQDRARARRIEVDYKDLVRQLKAKRSQKMKEDYVVEKEDSPYEHASRGSLAGKTRSTGTSEKEHKTSFRRKAHRNSAAMIIKAKRKAERSGKKLSDDDAGALAHKGWASSVKHHKSSMTPEQQKRRQKLADTPYKKLSKDEREKDKVSAKAIKDVHDKQKKKKVNEATVSIAKKANTAIKNDERKKKLEYLKKLSKAVRRKDYHPFLHDPKESFEINKSEHKKVQKKAKLRNLAKGNMNPNEKAAAQKKAGGPKLYGEGYAKPKGMDDLPKGSKVRVKKGVKVQGKYVKEGKTFDAWKKAAASALGRKKEERKAKPATDAGARARKKLKDAEHHKYVSFLDAPDD